MSVQHIGSSENNHEYFLAYAFFN